jgi:serine/threonine protein kinase
MLISKELFIGIWKPANILVTLQGEPKIADFGLAKEMSSSQELQVTQQGVILGTPAYMPPEQASGEISLLDSRSDIYSMGACLYFLLTKRHVFSADSFRKVLYKIIYEDPEAPSRYQAQIHRDLDTILLKALEKPQSKRYASAKAFAQDLQNFLQGFPILARPAHPVERLQKWVLRNRKGVATVALLFMAFLSFLAFLYWNAQKLKLQQFQIAFQQAQEKKKQALASPPPSKETQLHLLLDALKDLHRAQEAQPSSALNISQEKLAVSKALIPLACSLHNYQLAEYVLQEIDSVSQRDALRKSIETKRDEVKKHHQERLHYWFSELKKRKIKKGIREEALFEISKMGEKRNFGRTPSKSRRRAFLFSSSPRKSRGSLRRILSNCD